jgi:hypothetical protein
MKKRLTLTVIASLIMFSGASPWEGSAAVAPNGELPSTGFYIATNAFPRNTVVDITNIENGKQTRVIVSNSLTSPGLLAVVSREAAEFIGMRAGSVSRIRMIQPADPMAYMRFTEKMAAETPEYDSGNVINEEKLAADVYKGDKYIPPDAVNQSPETPKTPAAPGYIVDEPEWGGNGRLQIVDVPGFLPDPMEQFSEQESVAQIPPVDEPEKEAEVVQEIQEPLYITEHNDEDEKPLKEAVKDVPEFIVEAPRNEVEKDVSPWQETEVVTVPVQQPETETPSERQVLEIVETTPNPPPSNILDIFPEDFISGIGVSPEKTEGRINENAPLAVNQDPSLKTIDRLVSGKYYVQVAALPANLVENALKQIDRSFAPVIFKGADNLYRILIGPLNQGESAAVLVRFKSIGYKDAFVRMGG